MHRSGLRPDETTQSWMSSTSGTPGRGREDLGLAEAATTISNCHISGCPLASSQSNCEERPGCEPLIWNKAKKQQQPFEKRQNGKILTIIRFRWWSSKSCGNLSEMLGKCWVNIKKILGKLGLLSTMDSNPRCYMHLWCRFLIREISHLL